MRPIAGHLRAPALPWLAVAIAAALGATLVLGVGNALVPLAELTDLSGRWAFRGGDDPAWAVPGFDDSSWTRLSVPGSWGRQGFDEVRGFAWYRLRVPLPRAPTAAEPWGVTLGKIDSAYLLYAGGKALGGAGGLPPAPRLEYDRHRTFALPAEAVDPDGSVLLALRVWRAPGKAPGAAGPVEGPFLLGPLRSLVARETASELPQLSLVLVFLLVGLYHLVLRLLRAGAVEYGWFGLLAVLAAAYSFLRTQWKYALWDDFEMLKKAEHLMLYLVPVIIVEFLWTFLDEEVPRWLRGVQAGLLLAGAVAVLSPGLRPALALLPWLQIAALGVAAAAVALVVRKLRSGHLGARFVVAGVLLIVGTVVNDALIERGLLVGPRLGILGFGTLVLGMSLALALRFQRALADLDLLTRDLERRVADRTRELEDRGSELAEAYRRMEELALRDDLTRAWPRARAR